MLWRLVAVVTVALAVGTAALATPAHAAAPSAQSFDETRSRWSVIELIRCRKTNLDTAQAEPQPGRAPSTTTRSPPRTGLAKVLPDFGASVELSKVPRWPGELAPIGLPREHEPDIQPP